MRFAIFIATYLAVYGGMHLYFYRRLRRAVVFNQGSRIAVGTFLLLMVFGPMLVRGMEDIQWHGLAVSFAVLTYCWMGMLFMAAAGFLLVDISRYLWRLWHTLRRHRLPARDIAWRPLVLGVMALSLLASLYGYFAAREIRIETVSLATDKLPAGVDRYRMVQLSDIHLGVMTDARWLRRIVEEVNRLQPDLLVATGDIIDSRIPSALPYLETLSRLRARDGKYAVAGNHEFFAGIERSVAFMQQGGFIMLRGERAVATPWLHIYGVDDREGRHSGMGVTDHEATLLAASDSRRFNLLLKHQPVVREESIGRFELQLAGHVHQGQIFPFRLLTWLAYPVAMGLTELGEGSRLYVSRGTGTWGPPIRVLAPPEITLFEFVRKAGK